MGRTGRVVALLVLDSDPLLHGDRPGPSQEKSRPDAVGGGGGGHGDHLLPAGQQLRRQPLRRHRRVAGGRSAGALGSPRRPGTQPPAAILGHGDPSAHTLRGLRRIHHPLRLRHRRPDHPGTRRGMDPHHQAVDDGPLAVPGHRNPPGRHVGLRGVGLGRLLGVGPGGKRVPDALVDRDGLPPLGHHAGAQGDDEGLEHGPDPGHLSAVHSRHLSHSQRDRFLGPLVSPSHRSVLSSPPFSS